MITHIIGVNGDGLQRQKGAAGLHRFNEAQSGAYTRGGARTGKIDATRRRGRLRPEVSLEVLGEFCVVGGIELLLQIGLVDRLYEVRSDPRSIQCAQIGNIVSRQNGDLACRNGACGLGFKPTPPFGANCPENDENSSGTVRIELTDRVPGFYVDGQSLVGARSGGFYEA